jgi:hypothetical protein
LTSGCGLQGRKEEIFPDLKCISQKNSAGNISTFKTLSLSNIYQVIY